MKQEYIVTELAGNHVAGNRNPGAGATVMLTAEQAEHPLRLGHLQDPRAAPAPKRRSSKVK
ncbi:hypothetical protein [Mesorhizobium sp. ANAO-SY3R2]|uniref:hypothetical protein n=1 Tax=Mesorhizobium sp. ANAO-SY3R2 TaxID=3166644 RepID=UPI00366F2E78